MIHKEYLRNGKEIVVTFALSGAYWQAPIAVVGDFNGWNPCANPLTSTPASHRNLVHDSETVAASIRLEAGRRYEFRYVDGVGNWYNDGFADGVRATGFDSYNSILET